MNAWSSAEQGEITIVLDITTEILHRMHAVGCDQWGVDINKGRSTV